MAGEQREAQASTKKPVWGIVEKIVSAVLGIAITSMFTYMLATWGANRDMAVQLVDLKEHIIVLETYVKMREREKRSTGRTRDEQMQFNTDRLDSVVDRIRRIDGTDSKLFDALEAHKQRSYESNNVTAKRMSMIEKNCAMLTGQINGR